MLYAIVAFAGDEPRLPDGVKEHLRNINDQYAPTAWFVTFDGTADELTDLIWPDDFDEAEHPMPEGIVIRVSAHNGFASKRLWEWLGVHLP